MAEFSAAVERLVEIMARLRDPEHGCPWDVEQDFRSIAAYTIEEAYEVADAIEQGDMPALCDELGDLLLQVVFHARMAEEAGAFGLHEVAEAINDKMVRRHPHVFADAVVEDAETQTRLWEETKAAERAAKGHHDDSALAGIARGMPELARAVKLQKRAARVGFDWPGFEPVFAKLEEEVSELRAELSHVSGECQSTTQAERIEDELGDVLFVVANLARHAGVDPASALRRANAKFERRFRRMETLAAADQVELAQLDLAAQDGYWDRAKAEERRGGTD